MKKRIGIVLICALLMGCKTDLKSLPKPSNLIPQDSMTHMLHDLMLLESLSEDQFLNISQRKEGIAKAGDSLLQAYQVSEKRFNASFEYYASQQDLMQKIYSEIQDSMTFELNKLEVLKK